MCMYVCVSMCVYVYIHTLIDVYVFVNEMYMFAYLYLEDDWTCVDRDYRRVHMHSVYCLSGVVCFNVCFE
jgi:hypothetical protein